MGSVNLSITIDSGGSDALDSLAAALEKIAAASSKVNEVDAGSGLGAVAESAKAAEEAAQQTAAALADVSEATRAAATSAAELAEKESSQAEYQAALDATAASMLDVLESSQEAVAAEEQLEQANAAVDRSLRDIVDSGNEAGEEVSKGAEKSGTKWKEFLATARDVNQALELVKNVAGIVVSILSAPFKLFGGVKDEIEKYVNVFDEANLSSIRLAAAMKRIGAEDQTAALEQFSTELANVTRASDEGIRNVITMGANLGVQASNLQYFATAALAVSTQFDVTLEQGAIATARALSSGDLIVGRVKTTLSELVDPSLRAIDVLQKLNGFGGSLKEASTTGAAGLREVADQVNEVEEALGKAIADNPKFQGAINTAIEFVTRLVAFVSDHSPQIGDAIANAFLLAGRIAVTSIELILKGLDKLVAGVNVFLESGFASKLGFESPFKAQIEAIEEQKHILDLMEHPSRQTGEDNYVGSAENIEKVTQKIKELESELEKLRKAPVTSGLGTDFSQMINDFSQSMVGLKESFKTSFSDFDSTSKVMDKIAAASRDAARATDDQKKKLDELVNQGLSKLPQDGVKAVSALTDKTKELASTLGAASTKTDDLQAAMDKLHLSNQVISGSPGGALVGNGAAGSGTVELLGDKLAAQLTAALTEPSSKMVDAAVKMEASSSELHSSAVLVETGARGIAEAATRLDLIAASFVLSTNSMSSAAGKLEEAARSSSKGASVVNNFNYYNTYNYGSTTTQPGAKSQGVGGGGVVVNVDRLDVSDQVVAQVRQKVERALSQSVLAQALLGRPR